MPEVNPDLAVAFRQLVTEKPSSWQLLVRQKIEFRALGSVTVRSLQVGKSPMVELDFEDPKRQGSGPFNIDLLFDPTQVKSFTLSIDGLVQLERYAGQVAEAENRLRRRDEFVESMLTIWRKYDLPGVPYDDPGHQLHRIICALEDGQLPKDEDAVWLESSGPRGLLASYCEIRYRITNNAWDAIRACRFWREAANPERGLTATEDITVVNSREKSALFTTRGGAFRDLGQLNGAELSALAAIEAYPSAWHPFNLLGAIHYEKGEPILGDKYFAEAASRSPEGWSSDREIRAILANPRVDTQIKQRIAKHLLEKDSVAYAWSQGYAAGT